MCKVYGLDDKRRKAARRDFGDALTQQFNDTYGTDVDDLNSWQMMCAVLNMDPIPQTLQACQDVSIRVGTLTLCGPAEKTNLQAVFMTHVNLVDLTDAPTTHQPVRWFPSEMALSDYTLETKKFFPSHSAYAGGLLRFLLRHILHPAPNDRIYMKRPCRSWRNIRPASFD